LPAPGKREEVNIVSRHREGQEERRRVEGKGWRRKGKKSK